MTFVIVMAFFLMGMALPECRGDLPETEKTERAGGSTLVVNASGSGDYTHIQWAIDNASQGDTVYVEAEIYYENLIVNKTINLVGADSSNTIIDGGGNSDVILISARNVMVSHFGLTNSGSDNNYAAIHIINTEMCRIDSNYIFNNSMGIHLSNSNDNLIVKNTCKINRKDSILVEGSRNFLEHNRCIFTRNGIKVSGSENTISNNICNSNSYNGIIASGDQNIISNNTCESNLLGISLYQIYRTHVINNTCSDNMHGIKIEGAGIQSLDGFNNISKNICEDNEIGIEIRNSNNNYVNRNTCNDNTGCGIFLFNRGYYGSGWNNYFTNNTLSRNEIGIYLWGLNSQYGSNFNNISNNTCSYNEKGISLNNADNNDIHYNTLKDNTNYGIDLPTSHSENNKLVFNNFYKSDFSDMARDNGYNNQWNDERGNGNFWSDYKIRYPYTSPMEKAWDSPYLITGYAGSNDSFPLLFSSNYIEDESPSLITDETAKTAYTGEEHSFDVVVTDNIWIGSVSINYSYDANKYYTVSMNSNDLVQWKGTIVVELNSSWIDYYFNVEDAMGNILETSTNRIVVIDTSKPELIIGGTISAPTTGENTTCYAYFSDNTGVKEVIFLYSFDDFMFHDMIMDMVDGNSAVCNISIPDDVWEISFRFNMTDCAGNYKISKSTKIPILDNDPPIANAGANITINQSENAYFNAANSYDNIDFMDYTWNYTYGEREIILYGDTAHFKFDKVGTYVITLNVTDTSLNWDTDILKLRVIDSTYPTADAGNDIIIGQCEKAFFNGNSSRDNIEIIKYTWNFQYEGSNITLFGRNTNFIFNITGNYTINLTVTDKMGLQDKDSINVRVLDTEKPYAYAGEDMNLNTDSTCRLNGSGCRDNVGIVNYTWIFYQTNQNNFADDEIRVFFKLYGSNISFIFENADNYSVVLKVKDKAGNIGEDSLNMTVLVNPETAENISDTVEEPSDDDGSGGRIEKDSSGFKWIVIFIIIILAAAVVFHIYGGVKQEIEIEPVDKYGRTSPEIGPKGGMKVWSFK